MRPWTRRVLILIAFVLVAGFSLGARMAQGPFSPAFSTDMIEVDGKKVPDIGPLPTVVPTPPTNVNYDQKVDLGKKLFFDGRLSKNGQVSCAFCHNPGTGFADARRVSLGVGGKAGTRQAPTVFNTAFLPVQFWDGRVNSLEEQALKPIENPVEMAETHENVVAKLQKIKGYRELFQKVFGTNVNMQGIVDAIAAYERTVISTNSPFDKYMLGNEEAMSEAAVRGMELFKGKARCILCHNGPNFTDNQFHNLGVGITEIEGKDLGKLAQRLISQAEEKGMALDKLALTKPEFSELGRFIVTLQPKDRGAFKTPTLRSITETAPYMHDGRLQTLEEVIDFLDKGGHGNPDLSPLMQPLRLTTEEKTDLLAFLKALKGEDIPFEMPELPEAESPASAAGGNSKAGGGLAAGAKLYKQHCAVCHGPEGKGDGPIGMSLRPPAADLTSADVRSDPDEELLDIIANGQQGTAMPPWKGSLSQKQMKDVLAYIRSLSQ